MQSVKFRTEDGIWGTIVQHRVDVTPIKGFDDGIVGYNIEGFNEAGDLVVGESSAVMFERCEACDAESAIPKRLFMVRGLETPRCDVYAAIDGERDYADEKWRGPDRPVGSDQRAVLEWIGYMEHHLGIARTILCTTKDEEIGTRALDEVRKATGLGVRCMEQHGAPQRPGYERDPHGAGGFGKLAMREEAPMGDDNLRKAPTFINTTELVFEELTDDWREYDYAVPEGVVTIRIDRPRRINIHPVHGAHRIWDADGVCHYMPGNWLPRVGLRWKTPDGDPDFSFTVAPAKPSPEAE